MHTCLPNVAARRLGLKKRAVLCVFAAALAAPAAPPAASPPTPAPTCPQCPEIPAPPPLAALAALSLTPTTAVRLEELAWAPDHTTVELGSRLLAAGRTLEALQALATANSPAAYLLMGRGYRSLGLFERAAKCLDYAARDPSLQELTRLEQGLLAHAAADWPRAMALLRPYLGEPDQPAPPAPLTLRAAALVPYVQALAQADPAALVRQAGLYETWLPAADLSARSRLLSAHAAALQRLGRQAEANAVLLERFIQTPALLGPSEALPAGVTPSIDDWLARAEILSDAQHSTQVLADLKELASLPLTPAQQCRRSFFIGVAERKLRRYERAEEALAAAMKLCTDSDLVRRASYLHAKVVSIRDGLRAIDYIETFASRFPDDTMVDDMLFWAGDLYQRRNQSTTAAVYYRRAENFAGKADHCGEARWRLAWMAYRAGDLAAATAYLQRLTQKDGCATNSGQTARAHYWLGRIAWEQQKSQAAQKHLLAALEAEPFGIYAQMALTVLHKSHPSLARQWTQRFLKPPPAASAAAAPASMGALPLCPFTLAENGAFRRGLNYLLLGLGPEAARELAAVQIETSASAPHAAEPQSTRDDFSTCGPRQAELLLMLLLERSGAHRQAFNRLQTEFAAVLQRVPQTPYEFFVWRTAYPLAFREVIAPAEKEHKLPPLLLQALAREESRFDPQAVSWAGAYGLTQLLLPVAQEVGKGLKPPVALSQPHELLTPGVNAQLGAALLGSLVRQHRGSLALAIAAYNAGVEPALTWWKRHGADGVDLFFEEITIGETRGYVKRVLASYGIYRWLYEAKPPELAVPFKLPTKPS